MDPLDRPAFSEERERILSLLWVVVMFNMVFADIVGFLNPGTLEEMIAMRPPQSLLLVFSVLLEIPIAMIILSRVLPRASNRIANLVAPVITILWVIGGGTLSASYVFFNGRRGCMHDVHAAARMEVEGAQHQQ